MRPILGLKKNELFPIQYLGRLLSKWRAFSGLRIWWHPSEPTRKRSQGRKMGWPPIKTTLIKNCLNVKPPKSDRVAAVWFASVFFFFAFFFFAFLFFFYIYLLGRRTEKPGTTNFQRRHLRFRPDDPSLPLFFFWFSIFLNFFFTLKFITSHLPVVAFFFVNQQKKRLKSSRIRKHFPFLALKNHDMA